MLLNTYGRLPVAFVKGEGSRLWDKEGKEYIDLGSGIGVVSVGHSNPRLAQAICLQAQTLIHTSNLYRIPPQEELAKKIVELTKWEGEWGLFFANSGAEANETALKIARKYGEVNGDIKRYKIITLRNSFHGRTISTLKATGQPKFHTYFGPFPDGFEYADSIEDIYPRLDSKTIGVMIELIQGEGGVNPFDREEIRELREKLREKDILLIVDEVQTGVYRTGEFLASNLYGIEPDIVTLAKGLGGGVPIGAVLTRLVNIFQPGDHGSTFGGNYLSTRAGLEVLAILEEFKGSGELEKRIDLFHRKLESLVAKYPSLLERVVGFGLMKGVIVKGEEKKSELRDKIFTRAFENRVLVLKAGTSTIRFLPPLTITPEEIEIGLERFEKGLEEVQKGL
ncbi:MAG: aspartate aminotransferase family protein [Epsilonproteobacteria bacterium]|nr:aspartate aminotransferase family protein [Campylobacterota bacterium]NPA88829.1 aspartate aminotransferase family protein [Campylobacterota bacterium]